MATLKPVPGERLSLAVIRDCKIRVDGGRAELVTAVAVSKSGDVTALEQTSQNEWSLGTLSRFDQTTEILLYMLDDRQGGFVNDCYPVTLSLDGATHELPRPTDQLAAVILGEIYAKGGVQKIKIANDGYTFGIDAYARARNVQAPFPQRPSPRHDERQPSSGDRDRPLPPSGAALGSGSGILIAPGVVATNAHVIEDGSSFQVGRDRVRLLPIAVDPMHDLAILHGDVDGTALPLRHRPSIWLGEPVMAAGFPLMDLLGADLKVSTGNVSGLTGAGGDVSRFQFTAPIGSGSSGGAIVDECGNLVGVTAASLAHGNVRDRGAISENVNFGIKASLLHEMLAAAGIDPPEAPLSTDNARRDVVQRLRRSVVSINIFA